MPIDIRNLPDNHPLQSLYLRALYQESQKEMEILFDNKGGSDVERTSEQMEDLQRTKDIVRKCYSNGLAVHNFKIKTIKMILEENKQYREALEHICEVEMDSAEFEKEMMFNIARDALKGV